MLEPEHNPGFPEDCLHAFVAGDAEAHHMVRSWARGILRYHFPMMVRTDREDLVQETLLTAWQACGVPERRPQNLHGFVVTVAKRRGIDWLRLKKHFVDLHEGYIDGQRSPLADAIAADDRVRLRHLLTNLDGACRELILHRYDHGVPYATLAAEAGRSESAIRHRMYTCMKKLIAMERALQSGQR